MASLPKTGTITYEEWLRMPEPMAVRPASIGSQRVEKLACNSGLGALTGGFLKRNHFPGVKIDMSGIWPD
ncbi:MAG TPA: hypothetical protein VKJ01_11370 [Candidatus Solibacter sp.]|nr:hypothetical protein [Candidatus Solibacter sp.]